MIFQFWITKCYVNSFKDDNGTEELFIQSWEASSPAGFGQILNIITHLNKLYSEVQSDDKEHRK